MIIDNNIFPNSRDEAVGKLVLVVPRCERELRESGVKITDKQISWSVNSRAKSRWGQCKKIRGGDEWAINISRNLLTSGTENGIRSVIIHELIHTCENSFNHGPSFKANAALVNRKFGYHVSRTDSAEELGVKEDVSDAKYVIRCPKCGMTWTRQRKCRITEYPYLYGCPRCHVALQVVKENGVDMDTLTVHPRRAAYNGKENQAACQRS